MKTNNYFSFILMAMLLIGMHFSCNQFNSSKEVLEIGNELYVKQFTFYTKKPTSISVTYIDNIKGQAPITNNEVPYFEFVINNKLTTSSDDLWKFISHKTRKMRNDGIEHQLVFHGAKDHVEGLEIQLFQQVFPNSTLVREKLVLSSTGDHTFQLNKLNDNLHFKYPQYSINSKQEETPTSTEIKIASWELKPTTFSSDGKKKDFNHMFYPEVITSNIQNANTVKGPINIISTSELSWITAYEHASQDNLNGLLDENKLQEDGKIIDAMQGTNGMFNFPIADEDFTFLGINYSKSNKNVNVSVDMIRGAYLDEEKIDTQHPYSTVWTATAFYENDNLETGKSIICNYLFNQICENKASRIPEFYYNTWGMQRSDRTKLLRAVLTYERIFEEIEYASQLGVDIFVLDDGWEQTQGDWTPHKERLPDGLAPIKKKLDEHGIKMGIWLSPMGIDTASLRYKEHPEWIIKDSEGKPILAQWGHPAFDFVSGFFDVFIDDCKKLIDDGTLFFKWDAINTFYSSLPNLHHGSDEYSEEEIRARYEYLLPIYVTRAMEVLTDYEPELVIEMDVTEARRVMLGLAPMSQGKIFFMNNGVSWYNDYSDFRTMSMRTIPNEYSGIIPLELFTYANYPHDSEQSMHYNVNTSLIAGHGFWGNLKLMTEQERLAVGQKVAKSKLILPYITDVKTEIIGKVGDSPEIYTQVNVEESAGQILAFSSNPTKYTHKTKLDKHKLLAVLNHPYKVIGDSLELNFNFKKEKSTCEAFLIPNNGNISITSSTSIIDDVLCENDELIYKVTSQGVQEILWNKDHGKPVTMDRQGIIQTFEEMNDYYKITVTVELPEAKVILKKSN